MKSLLLVLAPALFAGTFGHAQSSKDKDTFDDARTVNNVFGLAAGLSVFL